MVGARAQALPRMAGMNSTSPSGIIDLCVPWHEEFLGQGADVHAVMRRLKENGHAAVFITVAAVDDLAGAVSLCARRIREFRSRPDLYHIIRTVDDFADAAREGKLGIGFHFQGTVPFGRNLDLVWFFHELGIRHTLLAYNERTFVGDGCHEPGDAGLSLYGKAFVREMNRAGMMVDLAHTGERTSLEAIEASEKPVIVSHGNARALFDHPRNVSDAVIRGVAASGGVVGVNGVSFFHGARADGIIASMVDHMVHIADLVGIAHVAVGSDFMYLEGSEYKWLKQRSYMYPAGYPPPPWDFAQPEDLATLGDHMRRRGFSAPDIDRVFGGNFLRVAAEVWK